MEILRSVGRIGIQARDRLQTGVALDVENRTERKVQLVVGQVERVFARSGIPRLAGEREGVCRLATELVRIAAERRGMDAAAYQLADVHELFGGEKGKAFLHGFNVISAGGTQYLVDMTFSQFIDLDDLKISQTRPKSLDPNAAAQQIRTPGEFDNHPIAHELTQSGYVPLDDKSLREYLRATTSSDGAYLERASVSRLVEEAKKLEFIREPEELNAYLNGKYFIIEGFDDNELEL